jgi:hypothetical protein
VHLVFVGGISHHPLVARAPCDHVEIRRHAHELDADIAPELDVLHELAERLAEHVRLEERELFPMIEHTIPAAHLLVVGETLERFEHPADR